MRHRPCWGWVLVSLNRWQAGGRSRDSVDHLVDVTNRLGMDSPPLIQGHCFNHKTLLLPESSGFSTTTEVMLRRDPETPNTPPIRPRPEAGRLHCLAVVLGVLPCLAGEMPEPLPSTTERYWLLDPVPREAMRPLSTDRPDQTESPYSVDAGHVQFEFEVAKATFGTVSADGDRSGRELVAGGVNAKVGLTPRSDLQWIYDGQVISWRRSDATGRLEQRSGAGDLQTRLKVNLWGNDGGPTALALMPYVKLPLSASHVRNGHAEGGLIVPLAVELAPGWSLGGQTQVDWVHYDSAGYGLEWGNTVTLGRDITERWAGFIELAARIAPESGLSWQGQFDLGFTWEAREGLQLDFGCFFGITRSAPDYMPFLGLTWRY
jgi:hypothetical protein